MTLETSMGLATTPRGEGEGSSSGVSEGNGLPAPDLAAWQAAPVWNEAIYNDLVVHLGHERTGHALGLFKAQLAASMKAMQAAPGDKDLLRQNAHGLMSTAGMLGFVQLSQASRHAMTLDRDIPCAFLLKDLKQAADRVLIRLRTGAAQAAEASRAVA